MTRIGKWFALLGVIFAAGCKTADQNERTLEMLKAGNFRGHISIVGTPAVKVSWGTTVIIGVDATMAADGNVDFSVPPGSTMVPPGPTP